MATCPALQAAVQRRMAAVWNELEEKQARGELVKGARHVPAMLNPMCGLHLRGLRVCPVPATPFGRLQACPAHVTTLEALAKPV